MMDICFNVSNQILERRDNQILVNKSRNYLNCSFHFLTSEWAQIDKFAIFKNEDGEAYNVHLGTNCDCSVIIPSEALTGKFFRLTVYGGELITTNEKVVVLLESGYTTDIQIPEGVDSEDVFNQIFGLLNSKIDDIVYADDSLLIYSNGVLVNTISIFSQDLVDDLLNTFNLSDVAFTGSYNDLSDVPETFPPDDHEHITEDITDFEDNVEGDMELLLISLTDSITEI